MFVRSAAVSLLCLAAALRVGRADETTEASGELVATLADKRIKECSGMALSRRDPALFWLVNDSGGEPCVFAVDRTGKTRAKVRIHGAANFDWEDLASGPGADGKPALFIGDIGDNLHIRPTLQIYQIPEPEVPAGGDGSKEAESAAPQVWHVAYPERPENAESLMVHPQTGQMFIVTKNDQGHSGVFAVPPAWEKDTALKMTKLTDLEFPPLPRMGKRPKDASQTTAAAFAPDGSRLVIATYSHLHEWRIEKDEPLEQALKRSAEIITPPLIPQLEAACYDTDSRTLWFTSERLPTPLWRIVR